MVEEQQHSVRPSIQLRGVHADGPPIGGSVAGLEITVDATGVAWESPAGGDRRMVRWSDLQGATFTQSGGTIEPDTQAAVLSGTFSGQLVRWYVPVDQITPEAAEFIGGLLRRPTAPQPAAAPLPTAPATLPAHLQRTPSAPMAPPPPAPVPPGGPWAPPAPAPGSWAPPPAAAPAGWAQPAAYGGYPGYGAPGGTAAGWSNIGLVRKKSAWQRPVTWVVVAVVLAVAGGGVALGLTLTAKKSPATKAAKAVTPDDLLARKLNLTTNDLPGGWYAQSGDSGPIGGALKGFGSGLQAGSGGGSDAQMAQCLGVSANSPTLRNNNLGANPTGQSPSPVFVSPEGTNVEAGDIVEVLPSTTDVSAMAAMFNSPNFASCFGKALVGQFGQGAKSSGSGGELGTPTVSTLSEPSTPGASTIALQMTLPVSADSLTEDAYFDFALVLGGRAAGFVFTFAILTQFPAPVLTAMIQHLSTNFVTLSGGKAA